MPWIKYKNGFRSLEGEHLIGFKWPETKHVVDVTRPTLEFTTKQLLTCGVIAGTALCCGVVFALPYLAKLIK
ncbi:MAG: hypothetical protein AAB437_00830 [Patescibacteria group bacterium]